MKLQYSRPQELREQIDQHRRLDHIYSKFGIGLVPVGMSTYISRGGCVRPISASAHRINSHSGSPTKIRLLVLATICMIAGKACTLTHSAQQVSRMIRRDGEIEIN